MKNKISLTKSERQRDRLRIEYAEVNKLVKKSTRANKRRFMEELAEAAEKAASRNEMRTVYRITRQLCGEKRRRNIPVKDKQGNLLTSERDRDERWTEHFSEVLNRPEPELPPGIPPAQEGLDVRVDPPSRREIFNTIKSLKNNKAPGQDAIPAELLKVNPELASDILQPLFIDIWEKEELPREWTQGNIVQISKKGNLAEKAFDSVHRTSLWKILRQYGIPQKIVYIITLFYNNLTCCVQNSSSSFAVNSGVRQGCVMSSFLFILIIDWIMKNGTEKERTGIRWTLLTKLEDLEFADDIVLISHTRSHLQQKSVRINELAEAVGLKINIGKTKVM